MHNSLSFVCQRSKKRQDKSNKPRPSKRDTSLICCALLLHVAWKRSFAPAKNGKKSKRRQTLKFLDYDLFPHPVCKIFFLAKKKSKLEDKAKRLLAPAVRSMTFFREKEEVVRKCEVFLCQHIDKSSSQKKIYCPCQARRCSLIWCCYRNTVQRRTILDR